jgi:hypothetical protein
MLYPLSYEGNEGNNSCDLRRSNLLAGQSTLLPVPGSQKVRPKFETPVSTRHRPRRRSGAPTGKRDAARCRRVGVGV